MIRLEAHPALQVHACDAMNTTFTLRLDCADEGRARDAASACFNQLEELEALLSRFRPDSDVSRIGLMKAGESLYISEPTHACLQLAAEAQAATAGLFDVTVPSDSGRLELAPDRPLVTCHEPGRRIDLGGIGKGFALDQLAFTLASYQVETALLSAGASTLLAVGPRAWPVVLTGDAGTESVSLQANALSASGTSLQGAHVLHPDARDEQPFAYRYRRTWLTAPTAALADAFSTACLLMDPDEVLAFSTVHRDSVTIYVEDLNPARIHRIVPG